MKKGFLQKNDRKKKHFRIRNWRRQFITGIGMGLCGVLLVCSLFCMFSYYAKQREAALDYETIRETAKATLDMGNAEMPEDISLQERETDSEKKQDPSLQREDFTDFESLWNTNRENPIDFESLWNINEDICAWIEVPGTPIDYPVLQHSSEDAYYLNHTVDHTEGLPGSIYIERIHPKDFTAPNTVLYGHNMKNGTMFGALHNYEEEEFFQEHPYVCLHLPDRTRVYQVFAATVFSDVYLPECFDLESEDGFLSFLEEVQEGSICYDEDLSAAYGDRILTLSTCIQGRADRRFLVVAALMEENEKELDTDR